MFSCEQVHIRSSFMGPLLIMVAPLTLLLSHDLTRGDLKLGCPRATKAGLFENEEFCLIDYLNMNGGGLAGPLKTMGFNRNVFPAGMSKVGVPPTSLHAAFHAFVKACVPQMILH